MTEKKSKITMPGAVGILLLELLIGVLLFILFEIIKYIFKLDGSYLLINGLISIISLAFVIKILRKKYIIELKSNISIGSQNIKYLIPLAASVLGLNIIISELANYIVAWIPISDWLENAFNELLGEQVNVYESFLVVAVIAPITEEVIMRGIILKGFLRKYTIWKSILYSTILFALMHGNIYQLPIAITMGILLGWIFVSTDSLLLCIVYHALNNSIGYVMGMIDINISGYTTAGFQPLWFTSFGSVILLIGFVFLIRKGFFANKFYQHFDEVPMMPLR